MISKHSPLMVFKFCPKCGLQKFLPDTVKSLKCGNCGFRYYINMNAAVAAIIRNDKNEVLFTIRKHDPAAGLLDLPGGFVDLGETAEEALKREVFEELNLTIDTIEFAGTFTNKYVFGEIEYQTLDLVFTCTALSLSNIRVDDDVSGYIFKDPAIVLPEEIGLESIKRIIKNLK